MRQSFLAGSKALFFVALTTLSVQADFNGVSDTNNVSVNTEVEAPFFQEGFESTAIASFTASPDSISEGESTTISWSTINAETCTPSGDLEEWNNSTLEVPLEVPSGELPITISTPGTYSLTLTCESETGNQGAATIPVTVAEYDCARTLPLGDEVPWLDVFDVAWPGPKSRQVVGTIPRYSYISLEFYTGQVEDTGAVSNFEATATTGSRLLAISKCPGDFNVAPECRVFSNAYQEYIYWSTTGVPDPAYCQLEKDTTYYWNTTFTDGVEPASSECVGTFCLTTLRVSNSDYVE